MKLTTLAMALAATLTFGHGAQARTHQRSHVHRHHFYRSEASGRTFAHHRLARRSRRRFELTQDYAPPGGSSRGRPRAWCGWEMRQLVGADPGQAFNLARNWAHWGHAGPAGIGAIVVWPHHVGRIVGRADGMWVIESGNDGHRVRTRPRSIAGAIAVRWG